MTKDLKQSGRPIDVTLLEPTSAEMIKETVKGQIVKFGMLATVLLLPVSAIATYLTGEMSYLLATVAYFSGGWSVVIAHYFGGKNKSQ